MSIEALNDLALALVAADFSDGHKASNGGPTRTSRALAIIHLAAHDAYVLVTKKYGTHLKAALPPVPAGVGTSDAEGSVALLAAGCHAAEVLYPDFGGAVAAVLDANTAGADPRLLAFGVMVADAWLLARRNDNSQRNQEDTEYVFAPGHHQPDPFNPNQKTLGRKWGTVTPFVLTDVATEAVLGPPPKLDSQAYALAYDQVFEDGSADLTERDPDARHMAAVGIFWGYDGANKLGTPPRLYNAIVRALPELNPPTIPLATRVRVYAAINAAMADAGIAAWHWKYEYDFWRPVVGIRQADAGWGWAVVGHGTPGDENALRSNDGDPFWRPLGAPRSNPFPGPVAGAAGENFTPNFPAYPSGHATFGAACFKTVAALLGKKTSELTVTFVSDEFNGTTTDHNGATRPRWEQTFTLAEAIRQNNLSRIYLGVHWIFDATGGEEVGTQVAEKVKAAFPLA